MAVDENGQVTDDYVDEGNAPGPKAQAAGTPIPKAVLTKLTNPDSVNAAEWQALRREWDIPLKELTDKEILNAEAAEQAAQDAAAKKEPPIEEEGDRDPDTGRFKARQETGDPSKEKPGGDGKSDTKPGADETAETKDPLHDFMGKRIARERRKTAKQLADLRAENARLKAAADGTPSKEPSEGELTEPDLDDPKYADDLNSDLYLKDLNAFEAQELAKAGGDKKPPDEGGQRQRRGAPPERKPDASPAAEAVDALVRTLDDADEEGKLASDFDEGLSSGSIVISDELVEAFDNPAFPEEQFVRIARMFVEKPWLSKKVARQEPGTHYSAMLTLLGRYENPPEGGDQTRTATREPLRGRGREPGKGKDEVDYAMEGDFQSYVRTRKAQIKEGEEPWMN